MDDDDADYMQGSDDEVRVYLCVAWSHITTFITGLRL